jgi:CelD/BcsL family acetyltransferase involved in cellulose biosynthesis
LDLATVGKYNLIDDKFGKRLSRSMKDLESNGRLVQRMASNPEDAERSIGIYIEQHRRRWQKKGSSVFENPDIASFLTDLARTVTSGGNGWINEILIDGEVAGQQMIICEGKIAYAYRIGINEALAKFSPGHIVTACTIDALKAKGFELLDLGPGEEWFKRRQGSTYQTLLNAGARRGGVNALANFSNLPVISKVVSKLGIKNKMIKSIEQG